MLKLKQGEQPAAGVPTEILLFDGPCCSAIMENAERKLVVCSRLAKSPETKFRGSST